MKKILLTKVIMLISFLFFVVCLVILPKQSDAVTLTCYSVFPENNYQVEGLKKLAHKIAEYTNGEVKFNLEIGGSLGYKGQELLRAVKDGSLHVSEIVTTQVAGDEPIFGIRSLPFLIDTIENTKKFDKIARRHYDMIAEKWNQKILYVAPWPFAGLWTQREIHSIKEMRGLKTRTFDRSGAIIMTKVGATPVAMPFGECYTSLATGLIDSMITSGTTVCDGKLWEVLKYYYPINIEITSSMTNINLDEYNKLTMEQQNALLKASSEVEEWLWKIAVETEKANLKLCEEHGVKILPVNPELQAEFQKIGKSVSESWIKKNPKATVLYKEYIESN